MFKFEYEIGTNEDGRPIIIPSKDNMNSPEHKFMAIEITRSLLIQLVNDNELNEKIVINITEAGITLESISDQIAVMLLELNKNMNDLGLDVEDDKD